ncbi:MAG: DUF2851 family protein, partial [Bacteroidia bacterium]|nr:DUF2851 family protein [Bacteroidia bacterium]
SIKEVENMLDVKLANYWKNHYRFDQQSINRTKKLGKTTVHLILINTIIPFLFHYGKWSKEERYVDKALNLLRSCLPESNSIIKKWKMLGLDTTSAHATQGLLQLKNEYCTMKKCLHCSIGHSIIKRDERSSF